MGRQGHLGAAFEQRSGKPLIGGIDLDLVLKGDLGRLPVGTFDQPYPGSKRE